MVYHATTLPPSAVGHRLTMRPEMSTNRSPSHGPRPDADKPTDEGVSVDQERRQLVAALERVRRERDEALLSLLEAEQRLALYGSDTRPRS
jgi:hypothetical protein